MGDFPKFGHNFTVECSIRVFNYINECSIGVLLMW